MKKIITFIILFCFFLPAFADTIVLKTGKTVTGKITEVTDKYIQIDFEGISLKYWKEDIASFEKTQEINYGRSSYYIEYGNERVKLDVYNPGMGDGKIPVVILIHGSAGLEGDRAARYEDFANSLMRRGIIAINVHYFDSQQYNWLTTFTKTLDYAQTISNADKDKIGLVGYSLGGELAFTVASQDSRVKLLAVNAGSLPPGFSQQHAAALPYTYMISGTNDPSIDSLHTLQQWFKEMGRPFKTKINEGAGHTVPMNIFRENWDSIVNFFTSNF